VESRGPITKLNAEIVAGTASEAKNPAVRLGFGVSEGREFSGPRIGKRKCVSWRFLWSSERKFLLAAFDALLRDAKTRQSYGNGGQGITP
jgi:hypothetical protein